MLKFRTSAQAFVHSWTMLHPWHRSNTCPTYSETLVQPGASAEAPAATNANRGKSA